MRGGLGAFLLPLFTPFTPPYLLLSTNMPKAATDAPWTGGPFRKAVASYVMTDNGEGIVVTSQSVKNKLVSMRGLNAAERAAVAELVGYMNEIPEEEARGDCTDYRRALHGYAMRMLGPLWGDLNISKWNQAKKRLADYIARQAAGFTHDNEGREQYKLHLAQGTLRFHRALVVCADG